MLEQANNENQREILFRVRCAAANFPLIYPIARLTSSDETKQNHESRQSRNGIDLVMEALEALPLSSIRLRSRCRL